LKDRIRDSLRRELEKKTFQSILLIHSICGGTGSGLTMAVLGDLQILKSKSCNIVNLMLMPSDGLHSTNSLEWYNAAASLETINDACDLTIMLDNQALYRVY
jgi:cell division GTPase FtsZ